MRGYGKDAYSNIEKDFQNILRQFSQKNFEDVQKALAEVAGNMADRLSNATPIGRRGGVFKRGWKFVKYSNVNYVYNKEGVFGEDQGIPLSNLFEYSSKLNPFIRLTWEKNKKEIERLFIEEMQKNIRRN